MEENNQDSKNGENPYSILGGEEIEAQDAQNLSMTPLKTEHTEESENYEIFNKQLIEENIYYGRGLNTPPNVNTCSKKRYCQMGKCAKMHTTEWNNIIASSAKKSDFDIVEVRFKNSRKDFFKIFSNVHQFNVGDIVAVEGNPGHDVGTISLSGELVKLQLQKKGIDISTYPLRKLYRKANALDVEKWNESISLEKETQRRARIIAAELGLEMKINNVEYQGDGSKAIFYYTADDRVDFRNLIKKYADEFKVKIEMKQIGARQEAGHLGGIGACGRELCCVTFMHTFSSVSTAAARIQQLSLNPQKLAGQCSKLKCCLNFESEVYSDTLKEFPSSDIILNTENGKAKWVKCDVMKRSVYYAYEEKPYQYFEIKLDDLLGMIEVNKKGGKCAPLEYHKNKDTEVAEEVIDFKNDLGDDELTRFDRPKARQKQSNGAPPKINKNNQNKNSEIKSNKETKPNNEPVKKDSPQNNPNKKKKEKKIKELGKPIIQKKISENPS